MPDPLVIPWHGRQVWVRHDDPALGPYSPGASVIMAAAQLVTSPDGLRRIFEATVGEHYRVMDGAAEEPPVVGLRRR